MVKDLNNAQIHLIDYNPTHKKELNSWQEIERNQGQKGLDDFVVAKNIKLGDYIEFFTSQTDIQSKIALVEDEIVGFVSFAINENNTAHIEIVGTNPKFRGVGFARKILEELKNVVQEKYGISRVTLAVNKKNNAGIRSFKKFAKETKDHSSENYIGLEF